MLVELNGLCILYNIITLQINALFHPPQYFSEHSDILTILE